MAVFVLLPCQTATQFERATDLDIFHIACHYLSSFRYFNVVHREIRNYLLAFKAPEKLGECYFIFLNRATCKLSLGDQVIEKPDNSLVVESVWVIVHQFFALEPRNKLADFSTVTFNSFFCLGGFCLCYKFRSVKADVLFAFRFRPYT